MIADLIQALLNWIGLHPSWALTLVFTISLGECLAIFGLFLPGTVLMFSIGAIVASGQLDLGPTLLCAMAGAIMGDCISFWLGRHFHQRLRIVWPFRRYPSLIGRGTSFFHRHGGKSVFLSRFLGPVRPILPAVAGMLDMPVARFLVIDISSAIIWAPVFILPGVVFGASLHLAAEVAGRLAVLLVSIVIALWLGLWILRRLLGLIQPRTSTTLTRLLSWSREHPRIRPLAGALLDPDHPEARGLLALAGLWAIASALFIMILTGVLGNAPLEGINQYIFHLLQGLRTPWTDELMVYITQLGDGFMRRSIFLAVLLWLAWTRHWSAITHWVIAYVAVAVLTQGMKWFTHIPRPTALYEGASSFAFPSGHTSMSMAIYGFLAVLIAGELPPPRRWIPYGLAICLIIPIAFSRLYLGAHWFTDVIGGLTLGFGWVALLGIAYRRHPRPPIALPGLLAVSLGTLIIGAVWHGNQTFNDDLAKYSVPHATIKISRSEWLTQSWKQLPVFQIDLEHSSRHPITLQWSGDLEDIRRDLRATGWHSPESPDLRNSLRLLAPTTPLRQLPVFPQVHDGRHETLRMIKENPVGDALLIVRLWNSEFEIADTGHPLWNGNVAWLKVRSPLYIFHVLRTSPDFDQPLFLFEPQFTSRLESNTKILARHKRQMQAIKQDSFSSMGSPFWNGSVLLLETD